MAIDCPSCGNKVEQLVKIDPGKKILLQLDYEEACPNCYEALPEKVSQGVKLRQEEEAKQKNKVKLWKGRVDLVKQGRSFMVQKAYAEAAMSYEKYLRVLELVYEKPKGGLTPDIFSNSQRSKELTIIVTVYWDLLRIYDTSPRYHNRMEEASFQLSSFAGFSPIYPDIVKKAQGFLKGAKNPKPIQAFLDKANVGKKGCFIATSAFGYSESVEVLQLREFRDKYLKKTKGGQRFIEFYYRYSPSAARFLNKWKILKPLVRQVLRAFLAIWQKSS